MADGRPKVPMAKTSARRAGLLLVLALGGCRSFAEYESVKVRSDGSDLAEAGIADVFLPRMDLSRDGDVPPPDARKDSSGADGVADLRPTADAIPDTMQPAQDAAPSAECTADPWTQTCTYDLDGCTLTCDGIAQSCKCDALCGVADTPFSLPLDATATCGDGCSFTNWQGYCSST